MVLLNIKSIILVVTCIYQTVLGIKSIGIPTEREQINLLTNVQEIFKNIKLLVNDEGTSTVQSITEDIEKMIRRAQEHLMLLEELAVVNLPKANSEHQACVKRNKIVIQKNAEEEGFLLKGCGVSAIQEIKNHYKNLSTVTDCALKDGQAFLDSLTRCATTTKLKLIQCYRDVIDQEVAPLKNVLLKAIATHKDTHMKTISLRISASDCVDDVLHMYNEKIYYLLDETKSCD